MSIPIVLCFYSAKVTQLNIATGETKRIGVYAQNISKRYAENKHLKLVLVYEKKLEESKVYTKIKTALEAAIKHWEKALIVVSNTTENILVQRECFSGPMMLSVRENIEYCKRVCKSEIMCKHMRIPDEYLNSCYEQFLDKKVMKYSAGKGLQYNEMLLLVSMRNREACGKDVLAWATYCHREPLSGRPFIAVVNYCYDEEGIKNEDIENIIATSKHEIGHALNEAKKHFGCNELDGVEVENGHFGQRVFGNEMMTPVRLDDSLLSRMTLAYFKDTQMYDVDYSAADDFTWGKNLGCEIPMKSCYEYIKTRKAKKESIEPFCDVPQKTKCVDFSNAYGHCLLNKGYKQPPSEFQYADETFNVDQESLRYYAGADYMDYCPYYSIQASSAGLSTVCGRKANITSLDPLDNAYLEERGPDTACFNQAKWKLSNSKDVFSRNAACHKFRCSKQYGLQVIINNNGFTCPVKGGIIPVNVATKGANVQGEIYCPECKALCKNECP
uniref:Leishmanolysin-like peptidase n=1 Tax=Trichobilharzia regenti TaxID=157069 RepID=A0AA85KIZ1_TRIRE|nr:unnamed protein product [Trichobilharzia regenti]